MQDHRLEMTQKETKPRLTSISALGEENRLKSLRKIEDKKNWQMIASTPQKFQMGSRRVRSCHIDGQILLSPQGPIPRAPGHP